MPNSTVVVSHVSGNDNEIAKHHPCEPQVLDCSNVHEIMTGISLPECFKNFPRHSRSKGRVSRTDITCITEGFCQVRPMNQLQQAATMCAPPRARKKKCRKSKKRRAEELDDSEDYYRPCAFPRQRRGNRNNTKNHARKLDSEKVYSFMEDLWQSFPEEKKRSFTHLDPLWYTLYAENSDKEKVLKWIKKKDIFSRKYVVFPIVQGGHWSLLIFCHFGESFESKTRTPCMLLLDSLEMAGHSKRLEPEIRKFVLDIYSNLERTEDRRLLQKMPFLVPKVPQQRDGEECGVFVLYYIKLFVESAPESFSVSNGYPYFMKKDWFDSKGLDCFCKTLDSSHN